MEDDRSPNNPSQPNYEAIMCLLLFCCSSSCSSDLASYSSRSPSLTPSLSSSLCHAPTRTLKPSLCTRLFATDRSRQNSRPVLHAGWAGVSRGWLGACNVVLGPSPQWTTCSHSEPVDLSTHLFVCSILHYS